MILPYQPLAVAETLYALIDRAIQDRGRATLAIPGGRSPGAVLTALAGLLEPFLLDRLHLFWVDERVLPAGHAERNDAATLAAWRAGGALPAGVYPMPVEAPDLQLAALDYARRLREVSGDGVLDLCLLGIGEDGHFASLFPQHAGLSELAEVIVLDDSPKPPPRRMSLSLPLLARVRQHLVLALGRSKGGVVRRVRDGHQGADLPISLLPAERLLWYCDEAAAGCLAD